jgi:hypothetical protein
MPTLRERYEEAKKVARITGMRARGTPHNSPEGRTYKKARKKYHELGEELRRAGEKARRNRAGAPGRHRR